MILSPHSRFLTAEQASGGLAVAVADFFPQSARKPSPEPPGRLIPIIRTAQPKPSQRNPGNSSVNSQKQPNHPSYGSPSKPPSLTRAGDGTDLVWGTAIYRRVSLLYQL
ncbi:hypothetical protein BJX68DRAFT_187610 [Aspergillus pseudodeflectus]|uniref:Uncharacterized protein n=1 Tax=Aspergillus pseudodeflectus TaxID=176178 RepID=A0ABR4JK17_9EURO